MVTQTTNQNGFNSRNAWLFFAFTLAISWTIWIPAIFLPENLRLPAFTLLGRFGPFFSAVIVVWRFEGRLGYWLRETFRLRISIVWYLTGGLILPFGIAVLHHGLYLALGGRSGFVFDQNWGIYFVTLILASLLGGGNEEPGWRGFAIPRLLSTYHPIVANCIVGIFWVVWHIPLYFRRGWSGQDQPLGWFTLSAIGLSIIMTWLYFKSQRSVIPAMLLHAGTNIVFRYFPRETIIFSSLDYDFNVLKTLAYWIVALIIIIATKGRLGYSADEESTEPG